MAGSIRPRGPRWCCAPSHRLSLAGLFIAVVANLETGLSGEDRRHVINEGSVFLVPLALMIPVSLWYFLAAPETASRLVVGGAVAMSLFFAFGILASTLIGVYAYWGLLKNKRSVHLETALLLTGIALIATGSMEYVREGIRKPYTVYHYLYANGLTGDEIARIDRDGFFSVPPMIAHGQDPRIPDFRPTRPHHLRCPMPALPCRRRLQRDSSAGRELDSRHDSRQHAPTASTARLHAALRRHRSGPRRSRGVPGDPAHGPVERTLRPADRGRWPMIGGHDPMAMPAPPEIMIFLLGLTFVLHFGLLGLLFSSLLGTGRCRVG